MPAIASIQSPFGTPGTQTPIGRYSSGDPLPDAVTRTYTLHVAVSDFRHLNFAYIKPLPPVPYNVKDLPLDMRVYDQNNKIELQLDTSNVDLVLRHERAGCRDGRGRQDPSTFADLLLLRPDVRAFESEVHAHFVLCPQMR